MAIFPCSIAPGFADGGRTIGERYETANYGSRAHLAFCVPSLCREHARLARVTVYWPGEGSGKSAAWNGAQLREDHCAVDPKKIPYGSKVIFGDSDCMAVDTGSDVVNRKAARVCGRSAPERDAIVIDRFFLRNRRPLPAEKCIHIL